jgi:hypothetical protein
MKKALIAVLTAVLLLTGATSVFGLSFRSPAEIYAELTGTTIEEAYEQRKAGSRFGYLAENAGVAEQFRSRMLENRKEAILNKVEEGQLTQKQADDLIAEIEENMANCSGSSIRGNCANFGEQAGGVFGQARMMKRGGGYGYRN